MPTQDQRIEDIMSALEIIKKKLPNGELEVIKQSILTLGVDQKAIKEDLEYFKKRLFNPDDGVIVRINKNTDSIARYEETVEEVPEIKNRIDNMEKWRDGINKGMWIIYTSLIGIILAIIFAAVSK